MYKEASSTIKEEVEQGTILFSIERHWDPDLSYVPHKVVHQNVPKYLHIFNCYITNKDDTLLIDRVSAAADIHTDKALVDIYLVRVVRESVHYAKMLQKRGVIMSSALPSFGEALLFNNFKIKRTPTSLLIGAFLS